MYNDLIWLDSEKSCRQIYINSSTSLRLRFWRLNCITSALILLSLNFLLARSFYFVPKVAFSKILTAGLLHGVFRRIRNSCTPNTPSERTTATVSCVFFLAYLSRCRWQPLCWCIVNWHMSKLHSQQFSELNLVHYLGHLETSHLLFSKDLRFQTK